MSNTPKRKDHRMHSSENERRDHERNPAQFERLAWSLRSGDPLRPGHVLNLSRSGIGLAMRAEHAPGHGGAIRLITKAGPIPRRARVVRISACDNGLVRVGCRWISQFDHPKHHPTARHARAFPHRHDHPII